MQLFTLLGTYLCLYAHVHVHEAHGIINMQLSTLLGTFHADMQLFMYMQLMIRRICSCSRFKASIHAYMHMFMYMKLMFRPICSCSRL